MRKLPTVEPSKILVPLASFFVSSYIALMVVQNAIARLELWTITAWLIGAGVELCGISIMIQYQRAMAHNKRYSKSLDKNGISTWQLIIAYIIYMFVVLSVNVVMEVPGGELWIIAQPIIARALLSILSIASAIMLAFEFLMDSIVRKNARKVSHDAPRVSHDAKSNAPDTKPILHVCAECGQTYEGNAGSHARWHCKARMTDNGHKKE